MASKWLEERWERLIPALERLGCGQEEQIKNICERELLVWKARPSITTIGSLQKPLTETRNRIRESIPVTEENGWLNPKSGLLEHLALKYLNFSTEEWVQINSPSQEELEARAAHVLPLANPSALLVKAEQLMQMSSWPEMAVGIGLTTGRSLVEILHTGHFTQKSAYSILFVGPFTVYERLCDPFEVPTLVQAKRVLDAVQRLRQLFGTHFVGVARHNISRECMMHACQAAYRHLLGLIPFPAPLQAASYRRLTRGVYSRLAVLYYCPAEVDEILYLARIANHQKILEAKSEEERLTFAVAASYREYVVLDARGRPDQRRGIRLEEEGVEVISVFKQAACDESEQDEDEALCVQSMMRLPVEQWPLWWQSRFIEHPDAIVEKAKELLASERWEEMVVGLTLTTGRCVTEVLRTGALFTESRYSLLFVADSPDGQGRLESFEIPTLVESSLVLSAWERVRKLKDCRDLSAQQVCERYRPQVRNSAVHQLSPLMPKDDETDRYTPLLRRIYARIAARYYCPVNKRTDQFLSYVQRGVWSEPVNLSGAYGCAQCWQSTYEYVIKDEKGNIDGHQGLKLKEEGVELLDCCLD